LRLRKNAANIDGMNNTDDIKTLHSSAPAKLNLFLEVTNRRPDGYHDIDTVMMPVDLCDHLTMSVRQDSMINLVTKWSDEFCLACRIDRESAPPLPLTHENLVYTAIERWRSATGIEFGFDIELVKNIPAGAGMGGASSDAASALRLADALRRMVEPKSIPSHHSSQVTIRQVASEIGSDVVFFLGDETGRSLAAARCTGRGEIITPVAAPRGLTFVIVHPGITLSTAAVYRHCKVGNPPISADDFCKDLANEQNGASASFVAHLFNRLREPATHLCPPIDELLEKLRRTTLQGVHMTGSGSACFGIAQDLVEAKQVASKLKNDLPTGTMVVVAQNIVIPPETKIC
jgi:4-diphosphocytidyl-2-C-methyl-D-erythritol kinase